MKIGDLVKYRGDFTIPRIFPGDATRQPDLGIIIELFLPNQSDGTNVHVYWFESKSSHWHTSMEIKVLNESR